MYTTITIDGTSGAGKSSIAKTLSSHYKVPCMNSGAMFRTLAYTTITQFPERHYTEIEIDDILHTIRDATFTLLYEDDCSTLLFNNAPIPHDIYTEYVAEITSHIASCASIRKHMRSIQRSIANDTDLIAEGRDMGTIVFPQASIKIFLTATLEERAERHFIELQQYFPKIQYTDVLKQLMERDKKDTLRTESPPKASKRCPST